MKHVLLTILVLIMFGETLFGAGGDMGGGNGLQETPYLIEDYDDFVVFSDSNNASTYWEEGVHTRLECDLDLDPAVTGLAVYTDLVIGDFYPGFPK